LRGKVGMGAKRSQQRNVYAVLAPSLPSPASGGGKEKEPLLLNAVPLG